MVDINKENPLDATIKIGKIKNIDRLVPAKYH